MILEHIKLSSVRNLCSAAIHFSPKFNIFSGKNGSGKTSILEAIHLLVTGRSFRSSYAEEFITFGHSHCVLSGKSLHPSQSLGSESNETINSNSNNGSEIVLSLAHNPHSGFSLHFGIEKHKSGGMNIHINQQKCPSIAELAKILPTQLINTDTYKLLEGTSLFRRQFLDWGMFHVEHSFFPIWRRYTRALKQRNAALKRVKQQGTASVLAWNHELAGTGEILHEHRKQFLESFAPIFENVLRNFVKVDMNLKLQYLRGWQENLDLLDALANSLERDIIRGYTSAGPHRADLEFLLPQNENSYNHAESVLSRGQQKLLICALMLARAEWLFQKTGRRGLFLVDDLNSELDNDSSLWLLSRLRDVGGQVLITSIEGAAVSEFLEKGNDNFKMFHVEHGNISETQYSLA